MFSCKKWTQVTLSLALILTLLPGMSLAKRTDAQPELQASGTTAYISVAVATQWTLSGMNSVRPVDAPALSNPVDMRAWTRNMTLAEKTQLSTNGMLETEALYGHKVMITQDLGEWVKVQVLEQPTPRDPIGYPGYMPKRQLTTTLSLDALAGNRQAVVTTNFGMLYDNESLQVPFLELSFNTKLPIVGENSTLYLVATPDAGNKWIKKTEVNVLTPGAPPVPVSQQDLVNTSRKFIGLPYLWAGVSAYGYDCSGYTYSIYRAHGITIPRDAGPQSQAGTAILKSNLQPGDLVFFATKNGKGTVHHVGMYIGNNQMIHSPNSASQIHIASLSESTWLREYAGARRYLP
ncbi:peptidase P60 [Paenibacillus swuensis]|uniref:Peptidase P60 n=1 Tax=Paenibacillus swuensis TaxID=1178515 RepID=A0A172TE64_9BACL|nr:C40 family peptidase [Paenibacillus swuensis]ANE45242.1 peptidase P60 [Paenibacillus swuensis]